MRRALSASRLVASVVATFLYLAFEEAMQARAARAAEARSVLERPARPDPSALSVHERPTLPGTLESPIRDLVQISPVIRVIEPARSSAPRGPARPAVLFDVELEERAPEPTRAPSEERPDVATLLSTLRRDVGCTAKTSPTHEACRAAEALAGWVDRDAVLIALEETVTAAGRPTCVRRAGASALGRSSRAAARAALTRMLAVARGRADWGGTRSDRELVALLLDVLG